MYIIFLDSGLQLISARLQFACFIGGSLFSC
ncbi:unnamed protein product [Coffea canephora]|uniref:Uncharacterized protein n=1 Tax=Coffea canephora TaxID=49390 RepID=A0A068UWE7_COFCA|nr:unnamed protein product [Coffea canephora]